jgi:tRNA modification GTPase
MSEPPTIVSVLTPPGAAAIATLALTGPRAWAVARALFRPAVGSAPLPDPPSLDRFWYGQLGPPPGDAVVLAVRRLDPVPRVEVHCHGGPAVVRWLIQVLRDQGLTPGDWPEALTAAEASPLRTLAAAELAHAPTPRTAAILLDQWHGALERALREVDLLIASGDQSAADQRLTRLLRHAPLGRHLTRPWRVAVAGAPNVGKSSLVNALAGFQRSVVTPTPGTTRDVVATALAIDGWPVELLDTAGWHTTADELEGQGIARARSTAATADLCLWVVDVTTPPVWPEPVPPTLLAVINKIDQPAAWEVDTAAGAVRVSARTGDGLESLCHDISRRLVPEPPAPGEAVPFTAALADGLEAIAWEWGAGRSTAASGWLRQLLAKPSVVPGPS